MTVLPLEDTEIADAEILTKLQEYRGEIDIIDHEIMEILVRRFAVARKIGALKSAAGLSVVSPARAAMVIERASQRGAEKGLDPEFVRQFYTLMLDIIHAIDYAHAGKHDD